MTSDPRLEWLQANEQNARFAAWRIGRESTTVEHGKALIFHLATGWDLGINNSGAIEHIANELEKDYQNGSRDSLSENRTA